MDQKLTVGFFLLGCVIIAATIISYNHIKRLEDIIIKQNDTIQLQQKAIELRNYENALLKATRGF
jgi:CHASE3 domain sensor protein